MTRDDLRNFIRSLTLVEIHEVSNQVLDTFIDEGYNKILIRKDWNWLIAELETITPNGNFDLTTLTVPCLKILDIAKTDSNMPGLQAVTRNEVTHMLRARSIAGDPRFYWRENKTIGFFPIADGTNTFDILYYGKPVFGASDSAEPDPIPEESHTVIADWAIHRVWEREEDLDRSDAYRGRFETALGEMTFSDNTVNRDRPKVHGEFVSAHRGHPNMPWLDDAS